MPAEQVLRLTTEVVLRGGIVLSPTDTIYGLACDASNEASLRRLLAVKGRSAEKGFLILLPGARAVRQITESVPACLHTITKRLWPGPVTLLVPASDRIPRLVVGKEGKVGCRVPRSAFLLRLLRDSGRLLVSTSANVSGSPPPGSIDDLKRLFDGKVDLFLEGDEPQESLPSSVLDLTVEPPRVVRRGLGIDRVLRVLEEQNWKAG